MAAPKLYYLSDEWLQLHYTKTEAMIAMRDGVSLYTAIYQPVVSPEPRPVIMMRTPFPLHPYGRTFSRDLRKSFGVFAENLYVIVFQNVRGKYLSEGEFENVRPSCRSAMGTDESTDTYDTIDWLLDNVPCNGSVGVKGISYPGFYATRAALSGHPALKAVSPQAPVTDWFMGDDLHHNGAFMLADSCGFGGFFFRKRPKPTIKSKRPPVLVEEDIYAHYRRLGAISDILRTYGEDFPFMHELAGHPHYDDWWKDRTPMGDLKAVKPAIMVVGGTYDAEDCYGPLALYRTVRSQSPETDLYLVEGPWGHGSWKDFRYKGQAGAFFGPNQTRYYLEDIEYPFFAWYLEGKGRKPSPAVRVLPSGDTAEGVVPQAWEGMSAWPPENMVFRRFYLTSGNGISTEAPGRQHQCYTYVSNPRHPVPYHHDESACILKDYMASDQRFLGHRSDVLVFSGPELDQPLKLMGPVRVSMKVSISTGDADIVVKLIDVRPDGYWQLVRGDVMPLRYRYGFDHAEAMVPGSVETVDFTMPDIAHIVMPGHRLMMQVQSSCFPLVAMNPQSFLENPYKAVPGDYVKSRISIYCQKDAASYVDLPVVP